MKQQTKDVSFRIFSILVKIAILTLQFICKKKKTIYNYNCYF